MDRQERKDQPSTPSKTHGDYKRGLQSYGAGKVDAGQKTGMRNKESR